MDSPHELYLNSLEEGHIGDYIGAIIGAINEQQNEM